MRRFNFYLGRATRRVAVPLQTKLGAARRTLRRSQRRYLYPWIGLALAQGAPFGLLWTRAYEDQKSTSLLDALALLDPTRSSWLVDEMWADRNAYLYLMFFSTVLLVGLGFLLGIQEDRLRRLAIIDPLTGLMNRSQFASRLRQEVARARCYDKPLALMIIDLDWLKAINDGHGHNAGDRAIGAVAATLRDGLRETDLAARYAGDEFVALLPETNACAATAFARRLGAQVAELALGPRGTCLSVSIGVADVASSVAPTAEDLFGAADEALFRAKAAGRNSIATAQPGEQTLFAPNAPSSYSSSRG